MKNKFYRGLVQLCQIIQSSEQWNRQKFVYIIERRNHDLSHYSVAVDHDLMVRLFCIIGSMPTVNVTVLDEEQTIFISQGPHADDEILVEIRQESGQIAIPLEILAEFVSWIQNCVPRPAEYPLANLPIVNTTYAPQAYHLNRAEFHCNVHLNGARSGWVRMVLSNATEQSTMSFEEYLSLEMIVDNRAHIQAIVRG